MGPTNVALVKLFEADKKLREALAKLEDTTRNVRVQDRRVRDLNDKITASSARLKEHQAHSKNLDLDLKTRDAHIEKLRTQQQQVKNNKEYHAFIIEINTAKHERGKIEEEALKVLSDFEALQKELAELGTRHEGEKSRLGTMQAEITGKTAEVQAEIDRLRPEREAAAGAVPKNAQEAFDRLADRFDGEAMAPIIKTNPRAEEYACSACNMDLVRDVYNKLHTRDELVFCPSCRRILFIPEALTPETAVHKPRERKPRAAKTKGAAPARQSSAADVLRSVTPEPEEAPQGADAQSSAPAAAPEPEPESPAVSEPPAHESADLQEPQHASNDHGGI